MKKIMYMLFIAALLNSSENIELLSLDNAIDILKSDNLEIQTASMDVKISEKDAESASGNHWGKLTFIQDTSRSNDAGNVFGFKLSSREATFGDFGFGASNMQMPQTDPTYLTTPPDTLNYPDDRNYFQSKLKYEVPLFTGFKITSYTDIMKSMIKMKSLEKEQVINEKVYQVKKSFYDMALLRESSKNLSIIFKNIETLENTTKQMIEVGYAKNVDLLEVQAKKGHVRRLLKEIELNEKLLYQYISFLLNQNVTNILTPSLNVAMPEYDDATILKNNLDIQKASTGLEIQKSMTDVAKSSYYPTIGAFGELSTADDTFLGSAYDHKAYTLGARLTWNIFNGGIDNANMEKSRIEELKTSLQAKLATKGIALKIAQIRTEIQTLDEEIEYLQKEFELVNEIYKNYEGRYKEKLSSMNDVIIKQSQQIEKILLIQQTRNKRNERIFELEKLANGEVQ